MDKIQTLRTYAQMMNNLDPEIIEPYLADDVKYSSQTVFAEMKSKQEYMAYLRQKLPVIKASGQIVYAEMGTVKRGMPNEPCVVLAQGSQSNRIATILIETRDDKISRLTMCVIPHPSDCLHSGEYPK
jgi:hypothetical protein